MPRREHKRAQLDLLPVMNLVTILIPLLLLSAQFIQLAVIDAPAPGIVDRAAEPQPEQLDLSLRLSRDGLTLSGADALLAGSTTQLGCSSGPCEDASDYDLAALVALLSRVKDARPEETRLTLIPADDVRYETLVGVMDATRNEPGGRALFPQVVIAASAS